MSIELRKSRILFHGCTLMLALFFLTGCHQKSIVENPPSGGFNFFVLSDMGSSGPYREDSVAHTINRLAGSLHPKFVINQGDFFHDQGVKDTLDSLWNAQFEKMFTAPELNLKWYSIIE